jgi:hypothetical protein
MSKKNKNYKIVYILGTGHSGSTLIDMFIGSRKEAFSLGELAFYSHYLNKIPHIKIDNVDGFKCTCGQYAWNCSFWKKVHEKVEKKNPIIKNRGYINTFKILINILNPFENYLSFSIDVGENKEVLDSIFEEAKKLKKDAHFLVDSSKDPRRLYELIKDKNIDPDDIYVLYLVRDGRAYVNSYRKDIENIEGLDGRNILMTIVEWIGVHVASRRMLKKYKINHRVVVYKDLVGSPERFVSDIVGFLNLEDSRKITRILNKVNSSTYHNLHGNPIRFSEIKDIYYDTSWKDELGTWTKVAISVIFYPFNKLWIFNSKKKNTYALE